MLAKRLLKIVINSSKNLAENVQMLLSIGDGVIFFLANVGIAMDSGEQLLMFVICHQF